MSNTEDIPIVCKSAVDVGTDCHKWPDAMQKYFNTQELLVTAARGGRHAIRVIDQCDGSHDKFTVRRILTFPLPGTQHPVNSADGGPLESNSSQPRSSGSANSKQKADA